MNQIGNPQPMMRGGVPMNAMRGGNPGMMRPVGVARLNNRYGHHMISDQDMLPYSNQVNYINRNPQQQQAELAPQDKLSHLIEKL